MRRRRPKALKTPTLQEILGADSESKKEQPLQHPWLTQFLIPFGSVLIAALALLVPYVQLPRLVIIVAVSYLALVAAVSLYFPGARLFSFVISKQRFRHLAKTHFPRLEESVEAFRYLVAQESANTLLYVLKELVQWGELRGRFSSLDSEHVEIMRGWLSSVEKRIERYGLDDFSNLCSDFSQLVHEYNRFCILRLRILQEAITTGALPEQRLRHLKQQWNVHREGHATFVREWENLCKAINAMAGIRLCIDYYEPVGTLE